MRHPPSRRSGHRPPTRCRPYRALRLPLRARRREEDGGAVAVLVAIILAVVLVPLAAIVIDLGYARDLRAQAQTAADAAALAAAITYTSSDNDQGAAKGAAKEYVRQNFPADYTAFVTCGDACVTFDHGTRSVTVRLPAVSSPQAFAAGSTAVSAHATASWAPQHPCVLCVNDYLSVGTYAGATPYPGAITASGGGVAVNGDVRTSGPAGSADGPGGTITVPDGERVSYTGGWPPPPTSDGSTTSPVTTLPATAKQKVASVTIPDTADVSTQLDQLMTASLTAPRPIIQPLAKVGTAATGPVPCAPADGGVQAYLDGKALPYCSSFAPGIYFVIPTCFSSSGFLSCPNPTTKFLAGATVTGGSVSGTSGALFVSACRAPVEQATRGPAPVPCSATTTSAAGLTGPGSGAPAVLEPLRGLTIPGFTTSALNGVALASDAQANKPPAITTETLQVLTNLVVDGDVYLNKVTVGQTTVNGRMVVNALTTGTTRLPSLTIGVPTAEEAVGPIRLIP